MVLLHLTVGDDIHAVIMLSSIIFKSGLKNTKKPENRLNNIQYCNNIFKIAKNCLILQ